MNAIVEEINLQRSENGSNFHQKNILTVVMIATTWNTVLSPNFLVWTFCGKTHFTHSFGQFSQNYGKLRLSTKFPNHEIKWNDGILRSNCPKLCGNCVFPQIRWNYGILLSEPLWTLSIRLARQFFLLAPWQQQQYLLSKITKDYRNL